MDYVVNKYGADKVSQIIAEGTMTCKAVVRKVLGVYGYDMQEINRICKMIPKELHITLSKAFEQSDEFMSWCTAHSNLYHDMKNLEGLMSHASTHAAGVIICPEKIDNYIPCMSDSSNRNMLVSQWHKKTIEKIGLYKFDLLALITLTIVKKTLDNIRQNRGIDISFDSLEHIDLEDPIIYEVLNSGDLCGIFQFDAPAGAKTIAEIKPTIFEHIVTGEALCRPGVKEAKLYLTNRHAESIEYSNYIIRDILEPTYGAIVYQEQTMLIMNRMTGGRWTLGKADSMRKVKDIEEYREEFVHDCIINGFSQEEADEVFDRFSMEYSFNKSHAVAYGKTTAITAYLKGNFRQEFMAATMSAEMNKTDNELPKMIKECIKYDINILSPDINVSNAEFTVGGNDIIYPITAIKGIGEAAVEEIIRLRSERQFFNLTDFLNRVPKKKCNKKAVQQLIKAGAFDVSENHSYMGNRSNLLNDYLLLVGDNASQMTWCKELKMQYERETLGMCLTTHPLDGYVIRDFFSQEHDTECISGGIVSSVRVVNDRNGNEMCFATIENKKESFDIIVFSKQYSKYKNLIKQNMKLGLKGNKDVNKMLVNEVWNL